MNVFYLTFVLFFIVRGVLSHDKYKLILERVIYTDYPNDVLRTDFKLFKFNRTQTALNMTTTFLKDVPYSINDTIELQTYEFLDNQYKPFAIRAKRIYCAYLQMEYKMFFGSDCPHYVPPKCPVKKGFYYAWNYVPRESTFPNMPFKKMKFEQKFYISGVLVNKVEAFVIFDYDIVYREKYN